MKMNSLFIKTEFAGDSKGHLNYTIRITKIGYVWYFCKALFHTVFKGTKD
jgi:hypothetical protein